MIEKYISQLSNPLILYYRKSLVTRTLFGLFSFFSLAFFMFSVGENAGKEEKTINEIWYIIEGRGPYSVLISFEKLGIWSKDFFHVFVFFNINKTLPQENDNKL